MLTKAGGRVAYYRTELSVQVAFQGWDGSSTPGLVHLELFLAQLENYSALALLFTMHQNQT